MRGGREVAGGVALAERPQTDGAAREEGERDEDDDAAEDEQEHPLHPEGLGRLFGTSGGGGGVHDDPS